jgi:hypothetical protein
MSNRDKLRELTVGAPKKFGEEIVEYGGEKFLVRQPSVGQRAAIMQASKMITGDVEKIDLAKMQIWATICCVYTEDGENVFTNEDYASLEAQPCGGFIDEFAPVVMRLMNVEAAEKAKNSEKIRKGNGSSLSQKQSENQSTN